MGSKVYILGGYQTDFERNWSKEGKGIQAMINEAMTYTSRFDVITHYTARYMKLQHVFRQSCVRCRFTDGGRIGTRMAGIRSGHVTDPSPAPNAPNPPRTEL